MASPLNNLDLSSQGSNINTETADLGDLAGTRRAAEFVATGQAIGTYLDGLDTIWVKEALAFSREHGIALLLCELHPPQNIEGSFPILGVGPDGVIPLREGHFPGKLFRDLLEYEVDLAQTKAAKYPVSTAIQERFASQELSPHDLRRAPAGDDP